MKVTIDTLERSLPDNNVVTAHWTVVLKDGNFRASASGSQSFTRSDESPDFIPFNELTEELVVSWLDLGEEVETRLKSQIEEQRKPTKSIGKPWTTLRPSEVTEVK